MSFWKVTSKEVGKLLDDWSKRETAGGKALSALGKELGAQHVGMKNSFFTGMPVSAALILRCGRSQIATVTGPQRLQPKNSKSGSKTF